MECHCIWLNNCIGIKNHKYFNTHFAPAQEVAFLGKTYINRTTKSKHYHCQTILIEKRRLSSNEFWLLRSEFEKTKKKIYFKIKTLFRNFIIWLKVFHAIT